MVWDNNDNLRHIRSPVCQPEAFERIHGVPVYTGSLGPYSGLIFPACVKHLFTLKPGRHIGY